ncbi:MAG TPA: glycosyltransferase, partial [Polyangiaceae bacterium]|nr:glycosyltransferase [Polyangiaceae bacterium]
MGRPLISVMVVAHGAERTLGFALASVSSQTMADWECIVVDDGSTVPTSGLVESLRDERFRSVRLNENGGRGNARLRGLEVARGELLAFLDADDWMYPERLETELACLRRENASLVGASMVVEDAAHRVLGIQGVAVRGPVGLGRFPFSFAPVLVEMQLARAVGFDPRLTRSEDVLFLTRALERPWASISRPLYAYRPSSPSRASVLEGYRCSRAAYAQSRAGNPIAALRLELSFSLRALVHRFAPAALSERV